jgi:hypothetical protein
MGLTERLKNLEFAARKVDSHVKGREVLDSTPLAKSLDIRPPESLQTMMQRMIRTHISALQASEGYETFEEANDFDTGDDPELRTAYEIDESMPIGLDYGENNVESSTVDSGVDNEPSTETTDDTPTEE